VIDATGNVTIGSLTRDSTGTVNGKTQLQGLTGTESSLGQYTWNASATSSPYLTLNKSRGTAVGTRGVVLDGDLLGVMYWAGDDGTNFIRSAQIEGKVDGTPGTNDMPGRLVFSTTANGAATPTERMRIDSSGNVGIGTSSPANTLEVYNASNTQIRVRNGTLLQSYDFGRNGDTGLLTFYGNQTGFTGYVFSGVDGERARIDSSGNLLIGTASALAPGGRAQVLQSGQTAAGLAVDCTNASYDYNVLFLNSTRAASTAFDFIQCDSGAYSAGQFRVRGDGVIFAQNTTVQSISDARTKENVRDSNEGLNTILGLRPVRFDFKEGFGNNRKNQLGFIAQEVETIFPDAVDVAGELDENGEPYKSVGPSAMIPVLVKAIQEQQAMIEELKAKVAALEEK
jgi:hypothetical protein